MRSVALERIPAREWAAAFLLCAACTGNDPQPLACKSEHTVYDPFKHEVCMKSCFDALDCPRGTLCAKNDEGGKGSCTVPKDALQTSRGALLDGFGVGEMDASLRTDGALELSWTRPSGARFVNCVLLACPPAFRIPLDGGEWARPDDPSRVEIANYDRCALASELSSQAEGSFNLREPDNEHRVLGPLKDRTDPSTLDDQCKGYGCAPMTELLAGCWAYDDTRIVAATRLFAIDLGAAAPFNYKKAFAPDGACRPTGVDAFRVCSLAVAAAAEPLGATTGGDTTGGASTGGASTDPLDGVDSDGGSTGDGDEPAPSDAPRYGVCVCQKVGADGLCADLEPCKAPCTADGDCDPAKATDNLSGTIPTGYCDAVTNTCVKFPA